MTDQTVLEALATHGFTRHLGEANRRRLAEGAKPFQAARGDFLARERDLAHAFYLIQSGHVEIGTNLGEAGAAAIQRVGPSDVVGWSWLIEPCHWEFDARALDDVRGIRFDAAWLRQKCEEVPELGFPLVRQLLGVLSRRLTATRLSRR